MCGIFGRLSANHQPDNKNVYDQYLETLQHRGPDDTGSWSGIGVYIGMRRLSIIDLDGGQQPIWNEDHSCCIVFNGEIYNFQDLRPQLEQKGHIFRTQSDTEVILHAYEEWGVDCLQRFNGMFALAIWDAPKQLLFLARDRIGEKPLYYYRAKDRLIFASEIKAILADPSVPRQLNLRGLINFVTFGHAVAPETIYQGMYKLLPGHFLLAQDGQIQIKQYWDVGDEPQISNEKPLKEEQYAKHLIDLFADSVHRRMIADVPVGAFLSGGLDSSAIVALMKKNASGPVKTFSLGFQMGGAYNELPDARRIAEYLGTEHYELRVESLDLIQTLQKLIYHYDEPFGDAAGFPVYLLSQFARQHVKVVLTGDGGDELFGGYRRYVADQFASVYQNLPNIVTQQMVPGLLEGLPRMRRFKQMARSLPITDPARRYASWLYVFSPEMQSELLQSDIVDATEDYDPVWPYPLHYNKLVSIPADHLNRIMYVDLKTWLVDGYMEKTDKATMAAGLEARLPLLDHRLVELAFQIPSQYKIKRGTTKRILKLAVRHLVPAEVLTKPKHGFAVPTDPWFRGDLKDFAFDVLLDPKTRSRGYFNSIVVEQLWHEHTKGRHVWDTQLWLLLNFELWHRMFLDG